MSLKKLWLNKWKILEGLWNRIFRSAYVEKVARERAEICRTCPHIDWDGKDCYLKGTQPCCSLCGCQLETKLRSLSSGCGDEENPRWEALEDDD